MALHFMHPADAADHLGVRRTRAGRWVYRGRTYRSRALALRRLEREGRLAQGPNPIVLTRDVPPGTSFLHQPVGGAMATWLGEVGPLLRIGIDRGVEHKVQPVGGAMATWLGEVGPLLRIGIDRGVEHKVVACDPFPPIERAVFRIVWE